MMNLNCKMVFKWLFLSVFIPFFFVKQGYTQVFTPNQSVYYQSGLDLLNRGLYHAAIEQFQLAQCSEENHVTVPSNSQSEYSPLIQAEAEYYEAYCYYQLNQPRIQKIDFGEIKNDTLKFISENSVYPAESLFLRFIQSHPEHTKSNLVYFYLGKINYDQQQYEQAISWLRKVEHLALTDVENNELRFKLAYSYFNQQRYDESIRLFEQLKEESVSPYREPSIYYFVYISYLRHDFLTAIEYFKKLSKSKYYAKIYPYYQTALYYLNEKFDEVISYAVPIIEGRSNNLNPAIVKIVAASYFAKSQYKEAIDYYQQYIAMASQVMTIQDSYQLGYAYYKVAMYDNAIIELKKLENEQGEYGQWGLMALADSYVKVGNKSLAKSAFLKANRNHSQTVRTNMKEEALFNYIKISYELAMYPTIISVADEFMKSYPNSKKNIQVNIILAGAFLGMKNYQQAIDLIENLEIRDEESSEIYQIATYYRGIEHFKDRAFENAIATFVSSGHYPLDEKIYTLSLYWMAEAMYEVRKYDESIEIFTKFVNSPIAKQTKVYGYAFYGLGYSAFHSKKYIKAIQHFERFINNVNSVGDSSLIADATLRLADSYFCVKDYTKAQQYYSQLFSSKTQGEDYALYQKGMILGLQNRINDKITIHKELIHKFPLSVYADDANFEIAYSYFLKGDNEKARTELLNMAIKFPQSQYVPKALITVGLAYYNDNKDNEALSILKKLVKDYSAADEAQQALKAIENIYVGQGNSDEFFNYIQDVSIVKYTTEEKDNIVFEASNNRYLKGDYQGAINALSAYLTKFENPIHLKEAQFIRAESYVQLGQELNALSDYEIIAKDWTNKFTRKSLLNLIRIYLKNKQYNEALPHLKKIELISEDNKQDYEYAIINLCQVYSFLQRSQETLQYAQIVKEYPSFSSEQKLFADYAMAKAYLLNGDTVSAIKQFTIIVPQNQSSIAAESQYNLALIAFNKGNYKSSQKLLFELKDRFSEQNYWVAKGFILLADNYIAVKDEFQAQETLKSIVNNYSIVEDGIIELAKEKLIQLNTLTPVPIVDDTKK